MPKRLYGWASKNCAQQVRDRLPSEIFHKLHKSYQDVLPPRTKVSVTANTSYSTSLRDSHRAVWAAIFGNAVVTSAKLAAHLATGSSTMLSETIHSLADTLNQCLLAVGMARAQMPASMEFPYGHVRETYVWALMSAVGIFFLGAGLTIREGWERLSDSAPIENIEWCVGALALSLVVEGATFVTAFVALRRAAASHGLRMMEYIARGPDPLAVAVLLEDGAAVLGVLIAGASLGMCHFTDSHVWDAVGSLAIGALLGVVAVFLITKNGNYLVGRGVDMTKRAHFIRFVRSDPVVQHVRDVKAEVMGVGVFRFKAEIDFDGRVVTQRRLCKMDIEKVWKTQCQTPEQLHAFLLQFGDEVIDQLSEEVNRLENNIVKEFPEAAHVDLEAD